MNQTVRIFALFAFLTLPAAFAQNLYVGAEVGQLLTEGGSELSTRDLGAQLGLNFSSLGVRAAVEGNLAAQSLESGSVDALLNLGLFGQSLYFGVGGDAFDLSRLGELETLQLGGTESPFGVHATVGGELRLSLIGVFAEIQPVYRLSQNGVDESSGFFRTRAGVNIHF